MSTSNYITVNIEVKRVQTYLFSVPRLKSMIGANVILGETIRGHKDDFKGKVPVNKCESLVQLAKSIGCELPRGNDYPKITKHENDPLKEEDDPKRDFEHGILIRDGGRFKAVFPDDAKANEFIIEARKLLNKKLPGVRLEIKKGVFGQEEKRVSEGNNKQILSILPQFAICEESGIDVANKEIEIKENGGESEPKNNKYVSNSFESKKKAAEKMKDVKAKDVKAKDVASLIYNKLADKDSKYFSLNNIPESFEHMCGNGYMAVIHADGNGIGARFSKEVENLAGYEKEKKSAEFFHKMRSTIRIALVNAIDKTFHKRELTKYKDKDNNKEDESHPFQLLMLGGDDLLFICEATYAFKFVKEYAKEIANLDKNLTIGAGIVIARPNFPFFKLHQIAEELASNAKKLVRDTDGIPIDNAFSVVDWIVTTDTNIDTVNSYRKDMHYTYDVNDGKEKLILSRRPLRILSNGDANKDEYPITSLEKLMCKSDDLRKAGESGTPARTQLRKLVPALFKGRRYSNLIYDELPKTTRDGIRRYDNIWEKMETENGISNYITSVYDMVEVYEINNLNRNRDKK